MPVCLQCALKIESSALSAPIKHHTQADPAHSLLLIKTMKINGDNELSYLTYQSQTQTHIRIIIIIIIIIHVMKITVIANFSYQRSNMSVSHFANSKLN